MATINRTVTIDLTPKDVQDILLCHFINDVDKNAKVEFHIHEEGGDSLDRFPGHQAVHKITITGKSLK